MKKTRVIIEKKSNGQKEVIIINESLSTEEKRIIKYAIYKTINESYEKLIKFLPPDGEI